MDYEWMQFAKFFTVDSLFERACTYVNNHLAKQMYLLGGRVLLPADYILASSLCNSNPQRWFELFKSDKFEHLGRLYHMVSASIRRYKMLDIRPPRRLPDAEFGEICLRFSLEPTPLFDFQLVRAAFLHYYYAAIHRGKLIIRFEDNNPIEGCTDLVKNLLEDLKTHGFKCDVVSCTSDYFPQLIQIAERLILQGKAYDRKSIVSRNGTKSSNTIVVIVVPTVVAAVVFLSIIAVFFCLRRKKEFQIIENADEISTAESLQFNFATVEAATDNFSDANTLGAGGFGTVYKGILSEEREIAVKRLSRNSGQGLEEFKNEVLLLAKLQHRNLIRLLGFCVEGMEKLLIFEFVLNASLDKFIFDPIKRTYLNWETWYKIIGGIARGLLYLHEDSRVRIIHQDLKASNILLDDQMNPKISDFGMARLFVVDQSEGCTIRIVGT